MADKFLSTLSKTAGRAQERVMQKLGKSDETVDEAFNQHVKSFYRQLAVATRLHKEARNFQQCIQSMTNATKSLSECMVEAFDEEWAGAAEFQDLSSAMTKSWQQLQQHASELLVQSMSSYVNGKFPELKNRIAKRDRKLIDYDRYRHALNSIKAKAKSSDTKLSQAEEEHAQAKEIYEEMNAALNKELPEFFSDRVVFYQGVCHGLYSAMFNFHESCAKTTKKMHDVASGTTDIATAGHLDTLTSDATSRALTALSSSASFLEGSIPSSAPAHSSPQSHSGAISSSGAGSGGAGAPTLSPSQSHSSIPLSVSGKSTSSTNLTSSVGNTSTTDLSVAPAAAAATGGPGAGAKSTASSAASSHAASRAVSQTHEDEDEEITKKLQDLAIELGDGDSAKPTNPTSSAGGPGSSSSSSNNSNSNSSSSGGGAGKKKPAPKVLFTVRATHQYQGLEDDELTFSKGDIITIIEPPNEDDLDEGWYFGIMQDGRKGVLPINFTERLDRNSRAYLL